MRPRTDMPAVTRNERGVVAGAEALAIGSLVMIAGIVLAVNAWAVIDTHIALDSAAREYLRTYTEADSRGVARMTGAAAASGVLGERNAQVEDLTVSFGPCEPARVRISAQVPAIRFPFIDSEWGVRSVEIDAVELIDAHREMETDPGYVRTETACDG